MVCRQSRLGSAMATLARGNSGLEDNQCLSLMHILMREGTAERCPSSVEWNSFISEVVDGVRDGSIQVPPRTRGLLERLEAARGETPDGPRFYAVQRIMERSNRAAQGHQEWLQEQAAQRGVSVRQVSEEFDERFREASDNSGLRPSREFRASFLAAPATSRAFSDTRSLYAYESINEQTAQSVGTRPSRPAVQREAITSSAAIAELGYDPSTGRCEVVMRSNPDRVYAYRLSQDEYEAFRQAPSLGAHYVQNIRANPDRQYSTEEEAQAASVVTRCPSCGEFAASDHSCAPVGSPEAINRDARRAAQRASGRPTADVARMPRTRGQRIFAEDSRATLRAPTLSRLQQEARRHQAVMAPILYYGRDSDGTRFEVSGNALVEYQGRGQGYSVEAVSAPGDSRRDNLRCTCPQYRAQYRCPHINGAVGLLAENIEGGRLPDAQQVSRASGRVGQALGVEYAASIAATAENEATWVPLSTPLIDNPEVFQEVYDEYRLARKEYTEAVSRGESPDYPVPYYTENVLGGLATRASGRGFGTEIEFSFPPGTSLDEAQEALRRIGRELYDAGLTRSPSQKPYGDSHGWSRDTHDRGWAFEQDPSTGDYWGGGTAPVAGGEIIAPIMYDEPESWQNISKICDILKRNGAIASKNAGLHVHVSVGDYDHRVENHNRLLAAVGENEDLLYRMSTNPERGTHRGRYYCAPNRIPTSPYRSVSAAKNGHVGHSLAVNLQSVNGRNSDHVEFRTFDSSLEPAVIQSQIAMGVYMAAGATRGSTTSLAAGSERHPLGERHGANPRRTNLTGEQWLEATEPIRKFVDNFVPGSGGDEKANPRVRQMIALFAMTKWQRA
jgi:ribosomal protein L32